MSCCTCTCIQVQPGDVLVDVNGHDVAAFTPEDLSRVLALLAGDPGSPVTMIFRRYGTGGAGAGAAAAAHIAQHVVTVFRTATAASSARPPAASHVVPGPFGPAGLQGEEGGTGNNGGARAGGSAEEIGTRGPASHPAFPASACTPSDMATDMAARVAGYDTIIGAGDGLWGGRDGGYHQNHYLHQYLIPKPGGWREPAGGAGTLGGVAGAERGVGDAISAGAGGLDEWKRAVLLQACYNTPRVHAC